MQKVIFFTAILAYAAAAPGYLHTEYHPVKSTLTSSSQVVNHGSTHIVQPVVPVVHAQVHAYTSVPSKTTITKNSQVVNHGGHEIVHAVPVVHQQVHAVPVVHQEIHSVPVVHQQIHAVPVVHQVHEPVHVVHEPAKSSQYFKLESSKTLVHTPVVSVHTPVVYSAPLVTSRSGDSAVSHHSSTVHETEHVLKSVPLYTLHH